MENFNVFSESVGSNGYLAIVAYFVFRITPKICLILHSISEYIERLGPERK